jgi:hypothetical protein
MRLPSVAFHFIPFSSSMRLRTIQAKKRLCDNVAESTSMGMSAVVGMYTAEQEDRRTLCLGQIVLNHLERSANINDQLLHHNHQRLAEKMHNYYLAASTSGRRDE